MSRVSEFVLFFQEMLFMRQAKTGIESPDASKVKRIVDFLTVVLHPSTWKRNSYGSTGTSISKMIYIGTNSVRISAIFKI